jgi:hypothetical protein
MQSRSLSFVSAHQARNSSVKALSWESTGVIAAIGRSPRQAQLRDITQLAGRKFTTTPLNRKKIAYHGAGRMPPRSKLVGVEPPSPIDVPACCDTLVAVLATDKSAELGHANVEASVISRTC